TRLPPSSTLFPYTTLFRSYEPFHPAVFRSRDDLVGIEVRGMEDGRRFIAIAPFAVGECVHREMEEAVELHFVPVELARRGDGARSEEHTSELQSLAYLVCR